MPSKKTLKRKKPAGRVPATTPRKAGSKKMPAKSNRGGPKPKPSISGKKRIQRPRTSKQFFALPDTQQETWNRVVHVIARMRAEGVSLTQAPREFGLDPRVVRSRAGSALRKTTGGRYVAKPSDKLLRVLVIPSPDGLTEVAVRGSEIASKIAEYSDAVQKYLRTGDSSKLKKFRRMKLLDEKGKRIRLVTDPAILQKLGSAGVLSFESLYRSTV